MGNDSGEVTRLGIVSDIHGNVCALQGFLDEFNKREVDGVVVLGDLVRIAYDDERKTYGEMREVLRPIIETGKQVLAIPGNYEPKNVYEKIVKEFSQEFDNFYDLENNPAKKVGDVSIVGVGGVYNKYITCKGGFVAGVKEYDRFEDKIRDCVGEDVVLVASHEPKRYKTKEGLDYLNGRNVGSKDLARVCENYSVLLSVSGHLHDNKGIVDSDSGEKIEEGSYSDGLDFSVGAVCGSLIPELKPSAGVLEFCCESARVYFLEGEL
jgi:Icc-related predicted phosphoesterase